jgi:Domain of unknown function (DUF4158)
VAGCDRRGRTIGYHRARIRAAPGFREAADEDAAALARWLGGRAPDLERRHGRLLAATRERCRALKLEPPSPERLDRLVRSAPHRREEAFCATLIARLPPETAAGLDALLRPPEPGRAGDGAGAGDEHEQQGRAPPLLALRAGAGPARLQSVGEEADKLAQ